MGLMMIELVIVMVFMIVMIMSNNFNQELKRFITLYGPIRLF